MHRHGYKWVMVTSGSFAPLEPQVLRTFWPPRYLMMAPCFDDSREFGLYNRRTDGWSVGGHDGRRDKSSKDEKTHLKKLFFFHTLFINQVMSNGVLGPF